MGGGGGRSGRGLGGGVDSECRISQVTDILDHDQQQPRGSLAVHSIIGLIPVTRHWPRTVTELAFSLAASAASVCPPPQGTLLCEDIRGVPVNLRIVMRGVVVDSKDSDIYRLLRYGRTCGPQCGSVWHSKFGINCCPHKHLLYSFLR